MIWTFGIFFFICVSKYALKVHRVWVCCFAWFCMHVCTEPGGWATTGIETLCECVWGIETLCECVCRKCIYTKQCALYLDWRILSNFLFIVYIIQIVNCGALTVEKCKVVCCWKLLTKKSESSFSKHCWGPSFHLYSYMYQVGC
jgi:hypothetical protein